MGGHKGAKPPVTWLGIAIGIDAALQTPADSSEQVTCSRAQGAEGAAFEDKRFSRNNATEHMN